MKYRNKWLVINGRNMYAFLESNSKLQQVLKDLLNIWPSTYMYITSLDRTKEEDERLNASGVHSDGPPWRAVDIRISNLATSSYEDQLTATSLCDILNNKWEYDFDRPGRYNVAYCKPHGSGPHIHIQVHNNTRRR